MPLPTGSRLGPYEILAAIGAGGMGEVYRARDTKLGRDVAIKILPEAFARDADRMARFQREAKVLAALNHSNIASIYGLEDSGSTRALVMELAEGPTLADRIKASPIPIDVMAVEITTTTAFQASVPKALFQAPQVPSSTATGLFPWDLAADGKGFLFVSPATAAEGPFTVLLNWQAALKK